jgi:signal peptidase I
MSENSSHKAQSSKELSDVLSFFKTLFILLIAAFLLRASVVEAFKIPSGSMIPTLKIGDHILVTKFSYGFRIPFRSEVVFQFRKPQRGDIIVFTRLEDDDPFGAAGEEINIIKRVIGLPGDLVEVSGSNIYVNNRLYPEPYVRWDEGGVVNFAPTRVPEGHLFLLGDNRDHSRDSRLWPEHFVDTKRVKGKAVIIYWSWDSLGRIGTLIR